MHLEVERAAWDVAPQGWRGGRGDGGDCGSWIGRAGKRTSTAKQRTNNALARSTHVTGVFSPRGLSPKRPTLSGEQASGARAGERRVCGGSLRSLSPAKLKHPFLLYPRMGAPSFDLSTLLPAMPPSSAFQWFLLVCPAVVVFAYFVTIFPHTPNALYVHPSLATLDKSAPSWSIYPDDYYEGGAYVKLPQGSVRPIFAAPSRVHFHQHRHSSNVSILAHRPGGRPAGTLFPRSLRGRVPDLLPQVVLIHGLSVPSIIWKDVAPNLAKNGYRVLLYGESAYI